VVTGILKDIPLNLTFYFRCIDPFTALNGASVDNNWNWNSFYTYAFWNRIAAVATFENKLQHAVQKYSRKQEQILRKWWRIYMKSNLKWTRANGDLSYNILMNRPVCYCIAGSITSLPTAQSAREQRVGVRKVSGASKPLLILQFLQSRMHALISLLCCAAVIFILPLVNRYGPAPSLLARQWLLWISWQHHYWFGCSQVLPRLCTCRHSNR